MSEQRFTLDMTTPFIRSECIFDYKQDKFIEKIEEIIDLLNSLSEENEELHMENAKLLSERIKDLEEFGECILKIEKMAQENLQLKTQINIFENFLEENDLNIIDWEEFCTLDDCIFDEPNFSCKECTYIGHMRS